jgi:hypothetical protein
MPGRASVKPNRRSPENIVVSILVFLVEEACTRISEMRQAVMAFSRAGGPSETTQGNHSRRRAS